MTKLAGRTSHPTLKKLVLGGLYFLPLLVLGYVLIGNWDKVAAYTWSFRASYLLVSFVGYALALGLAVLMWSLILGHFAGSSDFWREARIYSLSSVYRRLPIGGNVWHLAGRVYLYAQEGVSGASVSLGMIWETIVGLFSSFMIWLCSFPFHAAAGWGQRELLLTALMALPLALLFFPSVLGRAFNWILLRLRQSPLPLNVKRRDVFCWVALYMMNWVSGGLLLYFFVKALDPTLAWQYVMPFVGAWAGTGFLGRLASLSPIKLGIGEIVLSVLLGQYMPLPRAVALSILFRIWMTLVEVLWAVSLVSLQKRRIRAK